MESIFVSIASYRDPECSQTIKNLFEQASYPDRIFVGVCQQNTPEDLNCIPQEFSRAHQVRIKTMPASEARGPTLARYHCSNLYEGETYYLQIDSHTSFTLGWDDKFIGMYLLLPSVKSVLSYYPNSSSDMSNTKVGRICKYITDPIRNMVTFPGATLMTPEKFPTPSAFVTGCCFFAKADFLREVPFDPNLPDLFTGEEILFSARIWTHGWDIWSPNENLLYHHYDRPDKPKFWDDWNRVADSRGDGDALQRARFLLGMSKETGPITIDIDKYGMGIGMARSLDEFWRFAGQDFSKNLTFN